MKRRVAVFVGVILDTFVRHWKTPLAAVRVATTPLQANRINTIKKSFSFFLRSTPPLFFPFTGEKTQQSGFFWFLQGMTT